MQKTFWFAEGWNRQKSRHCCLSSEGTLFCSEPHERLSVRANQRLLQICQRIAWVWLHSQRYYQRIGEYTVSCWGEHRHLRSSTKKNTGYKRRTEVIKLKKVGCKGSRARKYLSWSVITIQGVSDMHLLWYLKRFESKQRRNVGCCERNGRGIETDDVISFSVYWRIQSIQSPLLASPLFSELFSPLLCSEPSSPPLYY